MAKDILGAILPGLVDSHGHIVFLGLQALAAKMLVPPDKDVREIATRQQVLEAAIRQI